MATLTSDQLTHTAGYPVGKRLSAKYKFDTFGALTLKERLPKVLTQIIDTIHRYQSTAQREHGEKGTDAIKSVLSKLSELRYRMQTNKPMTPILTGNDVTAWEEVFDVYRNKLGEEPVWFSVSWLFFECYMYRKVMEIIRLEPLLLQYDPFESQKKASFYESIEQMKIVAKELMNFIAKPLTERHSFNQFLLISLWGNKMDLSMAATMDTYDMKHQIHSESMDQHILANDIETLWELVSSHNESMSTDSNERTVSIVLDNSGFELFSDMCLAEWCLSSGIANQIILYCKEMPWFISDATRNDINWTLSQLVTSEHDTLCYLGNHWSERLKQGTLIIHEHSFWTTSYEYPAMNKIAPDLYTSLSTSFLAIFKGDLNYRKLLSDRNWKYTESFPTSLQNFRPTNVLALRTMKADLVSGLPEKAATRAAEENVDWMIKGIFAVIQLALK